MKVRALTSFSDVQGSHSPGDVFELPEGADWLRAGFVEPAEKAAKPARKKAAPKKATK